MPKLVETISDTVTCSHGGTAQVVPLPVKVMVMGTPVVTLQHQYTIAGCSLASSGSSPPCATGAFLVGSTKVLVSVGGAQSPIVGIPATGSCQPTQQPMLALPPSQTKVMVL
jgi:hypothetical protein